MGGSSKNADRGGNDGPKKGRSSKGAGPKGQKSKGLIARQLAARWHYEILENKRPLDEVLLAAQTDKDWQRLEPRDQAFARSMIMQALRCQREVDWLLSELLEKKPPVRSRVVNILTIAVVQILYLKVAPYAAIDLAVRQAKSSDKSRHLAKLVNAVLRRVVADGDQMLESLEDRGAFNIPPFLFKRWSASYGEALAREISAACLRPAPLDLAVRGDASALACELGGIVLAPVDAVRLTSSGAVTGLAGYDEGRWWVQDYAAQLPARLMGDIAGTAVLDLCAAPGGKTLSLIQQGAEVTALDISAQRLARVNENLARLGAKATIVQSDIFTYEPPALFDAVLLDAPCSATGTIRRHPDILHLKTETQIITLSKLQARMLQRALSFLKPGGVLLYCTCSLEPEEGEAQIERLLEATPTIERVGFAADEVAGTESWITNAGDLRLLPCFQPPRLADDQAGGELAGMDGFFIARLRKKSC